MAADTLNKKHKRNPHYLASLANAPWFTIIYIGLVDTMNAYTYIANICTYGGRGVYPYL